jgi:hypothetical protein
MIGTGKTRKPTAHVRSRSAKMKASRLTVYEIEGVTEIRVVSKEPGKDPKIVSFRRKGGDVLIECWDEKSLKACPANRHSRMCAHVQKAIQLLLKKGRRT